MTTGLFNSSLFTTIICLVLVFALLSVLVSTLTEAINSYFQERGRILYRTIGQLFEDGVNANFGQLLYSHPMIDNLKKDNQSLPQYISAELFGKALIDVVSNTARHYRNNGIAIVPAEDTRTVFARFSDAVNAMAHTPLQLLLWNMIGRSQAENAANPLDALEKELQGWYNDQMDRVSGWYKTWTRKRLFIVSLLVALALNVDSIYLFQCLYRSPDLRAQLEPVAEGLAANYASVRGDSSLSLMQQFYKAVEQTKFPKDSAGRDSALSYVTRTIGSLGRMDSLLRIQDTIRSADWKHATLVVDDLQTLGLPLGWGKRVAPLSWFGNEPPDKPTDYLHERQLLTIPNAVLYVLGILITAFSLSAGAPFWFDLLLRLVNVRRTGAKPVQSKKQ